MDELLSHYTAKQQKTIADYWTCLRFTRQTGRISEGIKKTELAFWSQYEPDIVVKALVIHIDRYPNIKEHYTRGIIRNLSAEKGEAVHNEYTQKAAANKNKSKFNNYTARGYTPSDYEAIEYLEQLKLTGKLDAMRGELAKDPRYSKFIKGE